MGTLTDEDLRHLLGEAAGTYDVPADGSAAVLDATVEADVVPLRQRRWVQVPAAAAVVAGAVLAGALLTGPQEVPSPLSAAPPSVGTDGSGVRDDSGPESFDRLSGDTTTSGGSAAEAGSDQLAFSRTGQAPAAALPAPAPAPNAAPPVTAPVPEGARVVKTGAIALIVEDEEVTPTLTELQRLAAAAGGLVASAATQESGATPSGSVTLRVPVDTFEEVVAQVRGLDAEVRSATTSGQDVTAAYADLEAQLRTLTAARERFLAILSEANSVGDILAVQQRVDDVTGRIDRLEGQRRVLAAQSEMATLEVTVTEADDPVLAKAERPDDGLGKAFRDAWDGFTSGVEGLIRASGRGILLILCAAAAYVLVRLGWRASRRRLV